MNQKNIRKAIYRLNQESIADIARLEQLGIKVALATEPEEIQKYQAEAMALHHNLSQKERRKKLLMLQLQILKTKEIQR
jgi:hypothetical protein